MSEKPTPPWADQIPEGSFISYEPTYKVGEYFSNFHKGSFSLQTEQNSKALSYYFYDPTEHGYDKGKAYSLLVFMHGMSNALEGDVCINYAGAEFYSKSEYQKIFGGAYILVPLANEYIENEEVLGSWDDSYTSIVHDLIESFIKTHIEPNGGLNKKMVFGNSNGGAMAVILTRAYPGYFNAIIPMGAAEIPDEALLDSYDEHDTALFFAAGKHDEFSSYEENVVPLLPRLKKMKRCYIYTPDWVQNGDHGIASINFGCEMGQHCIINPMHCNLKFDDGTLMDENLPDGVAGWLSHLLE